MMAKGLPRRRWSEADDEIVRARYPHEDTAALAKEIGTLPTRLHRRAQMLKVRKTPDYLRAIAQRACVKNGERSRFQKGQTPKNKGKLLREYVTDPATRERIARTQFKVGNKPPPYLPVWSYTQDPDGYWKIKVSDHGSRGHGGANRSHWDWRYVHRLTYEAAFGPIPKGGIVILLDGDHHNCLDPSNVACITRAELARLNQSGFSDLPPDRELRRAAVTEAKVRQAIHEAGKSAGISLEDRCAAVGKLGGFRRKP